MVNEPLPRRLNLGCGRDLRPDCLNVDRSAEVGADMVLDLGQAPYPLPCDHFEHIWALDVVEHLDDLLAFMEEVHRLLRPGGTVEITAPHFSCANSFTDPTHKRHLGCFSFDYFLADHKLAYYSRARFTLEERLLVFPSTWLDSLFARWARRHLAFYERRLAWVWPAWFLVFKLRAVKEEPR